MRHNDPATARILYQQAVSGLQELALLRPGWETNVVAVKIKTVLQKIAALPASAPAVVPPSGLLTPAPGEPLPRGAREYEFNGRKVYLIPLAG